MAVAYSAQEIITKLATDDVPGGWSLHEVFEHTFYKGEVFAAIVVTNVTEGPIRTIADYAGLKLNRGNCIAGTISEVPLSLNYLEVALWSSFAKEAKTTVLDLPCPLNDLAIQSVYMALYAWLSFLRVPGQSWAFLEDGVTLWREIQSHNEPRDRYCRWGGSKMCFS